MQRTRRTAMAACRWMRMAGPYFGGCDIIAFVCLQFACHYHRDILSYWPPK